MSAVLGIAENQCIPGGKTPPPSYYEALRYPVDAEEKYAPVKYVDVLTDEENDIYSTFYQEHFSLSPETILLHSESDNDEPSIFPITPVENDPSKISEFSNPDVSEDTRKQSFDTGNSPAKDQFTNYMFFTNATFEEKKVPDINKTICAQNDPSKQCCDSDVEHGRSETPYIVDHSKAFSEPDVVQDRSCELEIENPCEGLDAVPDNFVEPDGEEQLSEDCKELSEVHLRNQSPFKGYSNGCRPISGITTRSFSPEPGPSGYAGARNKGPRKMTVTYDSRNGSYRTLPTSSSENVNSVNEMTCRIDPEMDKQALRTGEAADRGTLYCACGILFCIIGIVVILVYIA